MKNPLLSIVIPAFNEEENICNTARVVEDIMVKEQIPYEIIFVSDGSRDATFAKILELAKLDTRIRGLEFSRNFGKESAIFAGLSAIRGGCAVVMDCDLQHPPKTIVEMYRKWEEGFEVVEGIKNTRGKESPIRRFFAGLFYKTLSALTGFDMENTSDFKLLSKNVIQVLLDMPERKTFFRAMSFWVGFRSCQVHYDVADRAFGTTKWSFFKLMKYAITNIMSYSTRPLSLISYMGTASILVGVVLGVQTLVRWASGKALEGFTTVILLLLLLGGGIMLALGILGGYVAAIYHEVKGRPRYVVRLDTDKLLTQGDSDE
ncbi:MAG: glycosyltransferase family 2 protein [Ruminococcaceae bacterium]|nr:glycosyltransferase family 2 protein [Oscillospiraceae bacterium]